LLISLSLPLLLPFGTSFLICIYFSYCSFAPFTASFTFLSHEFHPFFLSLKFVFYSRRFFVSLFIPCLIRITFSHIDLITERVNGQKSWLCFNPKLSVG
jgi:hypothetical protein